MATITGYTKAKMDEINNKTVVDANVNGSGHLILELRDGSTIDAGSVIGPMGPEGSLKPGDFKTSCVTVAATGWLHMNGQSIANADTAYAALWAVVPASWKTGTTLTLPDMTNRILQGGAAGTIGDLVGANTKTLLEENLPPHVHTGPSHTHTGGVHTHGMAHTHTIAHTHDHPHTHGDSFNVSVLVQAAVRENSTPGSTNSLMIASGTGISELQENNPLAYATVNGSVGAASENTTTGSSVANTGAASAASTGSAGAVATSAAGTGNTGPGNGTSVPVDVQQAALKVNVFIKT